MNKICNKSLEKNGSHFSLMVYCSLCSGHVEPHSYTEHYVDGTKLQIIWGEAEEIVC